MGSKYVYMYIKYSIYLIGLVSYSTCVDTSIYARTYHQIIKLFIQIINTFDRFLTPI